MICILPETSLPRPIASFAAAPGRAGAGRGRAAARPLAHRKNLARPAGRAVDAMTFQSMIGRQRAAASDRPPLPSGRGSVLSRFAVHRLETGATAARMPQGQRTPNIGSSYVAGFRRLRTVSTRCGSCLWMGSSNSARNFWTIVRIQPFGPIILQRVPCFRCQAAPSNLASGMLVSTASSRQWRRMRSISFRVAAVR